MSPKIIIGIVVAFIIFLFIGGSLYVVQEGHLALTLRLGKLVTIAKTGEAKITAPGLHFKWPLFEDVRIFDVRLQNLESESPRILTQEQKYLYVDYYAKWKIADLSLYYMRTGGVSEKAQSLLVQKLNDSLRAEFGKKNLQELVADDRLKIMKSLQNSANEGAKGLGLDIIDVRIKSIDLLKQVQQSVFQRMSTKREEVATEYRADGQAQAESITAEADTKAKKMIADARNQAAQTRSQGDAEAAAIYTKAYSQDPAFYAFYRSLEAYREVFNNKGTMMVLKPDSDFFKYFNQPAKAQTIQKTGTK